MLGLKLNNFSKGGPFCQANTTNIAHCCLFGLFVFPMITWYLVISIMVALIYVNIWREKNILSKNICLYYSHLVIPG